MLHFLNLLTPRIITLRLPLVNIQYLAMRSSLLMQDEIVNAEHELSESSRSHGIVQSYRNSSLL